ncbi:DUF4817 domain-containing protein [Caerostris extrusa]|uniref:DUF4817 domain-containing protein n=1 Tax=Caerostris extrusa TaxID=172846 RepID=A0AAV4VZN8_CAEEX|nr:DUF4817 domain-containing protein [Caerostris extrusa]
MKQIRRSSMSPCVLREMIQKFETPGQFGILPDRGRKQIRLIASKMWLQRSKLSPSRRMDGDSDDRNTFEVKFLARMVVDVTWPWNSLASMGKLILTIVKFGLRKTLTLT